MKRKFTIVTFLLMTFFTLDITAQWCLPTLLPYGPGMPGITQFTLNDINRVSADLESSTNNYVLTGLSTTVHRDQTYTVSITHTIDALICPDMNLRIWIDYNGNGDLDDAGETAISIDHHAPGKYEATFTVPVTAVLGDTRLRATAKMSNLGGHTPPTPCNIPVDPLGYHGEMEDYTLTIEEATGIEEQVQNQFISVFPNPSSDNCLLSYHLESAQQVTIHVYNQTGKEEMVIADELQNAGDHTFQISTKDLPGGFYIVQINAANRMYTQKLMVVHE